jgi:hypothetical protein
MDKLKDLIIRSGITLGQFKVHFATGQDIPPLDAFREGKFKEWQELQYNQNFKCDQILSLIHLGADKWLFAGVYTVEGVKQMNKGEPYIFWHMESVPRKCFKYTTREMDGLEHLTGRAIVQFQKNFRASYVFPTTGNCYDNFVVSKILDQRMSAKEEKSLSNIKEPATSQIYSHYGKRSGPQFGAPIDFRGLRHAPINENGVIFLFGMVSYELGFIVEAIHNAYPDCEAKRCFDRRRNRWQRVHIEFEYKSTNFKEHGHDPINCNLIVCWENDWADCPIEVIELMQVIKELPKEV